MSKRINDNISRQKYSIITFFTALCFLFASHAVLAQLIGPVDPPPLGAVFQQTGTPNDGLWGRPGGKTYTISNVNHSNNTPMYWGVADGEVKLSLDGNDFSDPGEIMAFDPALSDLPNGIVYWSGTTTYTGPVFSRFRLIFTDANTDAPLALTLATDVGLPANVGAVLPIVNSAMAFKVNLQFLASSNVNGPYEPHLDFYDPTPDPSYSGLAHSSLIRGYYYVNTPPFLTANVNLQVDEGGSVTVLSADLSASDYESGPAGLTYTLNPQDQGGIPRFGELDKSGVVLGTDDTFTQEDIDLNAVTYTHDGSGNSTDSFNFTVQDEQGAIASDGPFTLFKKTINITPVNDPPVPIDGSGQASIDGTYEGVFEADDEEGDALEFSVDSVDFGAAQIIDAQAGTFSFAAPAGFVGDATIDFQVWDGTAFADAPGKFVVTVPDPNIAVLNSGDLLIANGDKLILHNFPENTDWVLSEGNNFTNLKALGFDGEDSIYVMDAVNGLIRVDPVTGSQSIVTTGDNFVEDNPVGVATEDTDSILVSNLDFGGTPSIKRIDADTGAIVNEFSGDLMGVPTDVVVNEEDKIFVTDASAFAGGTSEVIEVNPDSGVQSSVSLGGELLVPLALTVEPDGNIIVADAPLPMVPGGVNKLIRIDTSVVIAPADVAIPDNQVILSQGDHISTTLTDVTAGYNGKIYAANGTNVIDVDPVTGVQTLVATEPVVDSPTRIIVYFKEGIFEDSFEGDPPPPED